jgi:acyl-CoA synthetase (AMP-forming)/AMP-acid ligase II
MSAALASPAPSERPASRLIGGVFEFWAHTRPRHPAVLYEGSSLSYGELHERALVIARSLLALGIRRGDRVGALLSNQPEWVAMAVGAASIGTSGLNSPGQLVTAGLPRWSAWISS